MGRKKPFMPRAQTRTYQVVYRPLADTTAPPEDGDRVLQFVPSGNQRAARRAGDAATSVAFTDADVDAEEAVAYVPPAPELAAAAATYHRKAWELGEYGFPDDGYDYSQHFRPMAGGGTGGVFLLSQGGGGGGGGGGGSRAAAAAPPVEEVLAGGRAERAAAELRARDKDVDDILAALESDGDDGVAGQYDDVSSDGGGADSDSDGVFDDDFVAVASGRTAAEEAYRAGAAERAAEEAAERRAEARAARAAAGGGAPHNAPLDGVRPPRLLDEHFESVLKAYAASDSEGETSDDEAGAPSVGGATATTATAGGGGGTTCPTMPTSLTLFTRTFRRTGCTTR